MHTNFQFKAKLSRSPNVKEKLKWCISRTTTAVI